MEETEYRQTQSRKCKKVGNKTKIQLLVILHFLKYDYLAIEMFDK